MYNKVTATPPKWSVWLKSIRVLYASKAVKWNKCRRHWKLSLQTTFHGITAVWRPVRLAPPLPLPSPSAGEYRDLFWAPRDRLGRATDREINSTISYPLPGSASPLWHRPEEIVPSGGVTWSAAVGGAIARHLHNHGGGPPMEWQACAFQQWPNDATVVFFFPLSIFPPVLLGSERCEGKCFVMVKPVTSTISIS